MPRMTFEEFCRILAEELDVDESKLSPETSFVEDLMADSIQLVEMMLSLEERGIQIPVETAWQVRTVGDAYRLYAQAMEAKRS
ncbi:MAG: acyl carrier protein [Anaerolineae bacterium]